MKKKLGKNMQINEKSKSKAQQRLLGAAYAFTKGELKDAPKVIKDVAKSFIKKGKKKGTKSLRDFAKTKHKGLPERTTKIEERILNFSSFIKESYEFENFSLNDMEIVKELYNDGLSDIKQLSIETDLSKETIIQILDTLRKRGDIK